MSAAFDSTAAPGKPHPLFSLQGQAVLVTGAGSEEGIGFAAARLLAELGAKVAVAATGPRIHQRCAELRAAGYEARAYQADLTDRAAAFAMVESVLADFGCIDVLVNNAGMSMQGSSEPFSTLAETDPAAWDSTISRNLGTCFNVTRACLSAMLARRYGRIVNVSSVTGPLVSNPGEAAYSAAKAAMVGMSRALALEVATAGITVNNLAPGWVGTASQSEEEVAASRYTPLGRAGTALEMAHAIAFLASPGASYITGQVIVVDGANCLQERKGP